MVFTKCLDIVRRAAYHARLSGKPSPLSQPGGEQEKREVFDALLIRRSPHLQPRRAQAWMRPAVSSFIKWRKLRCNP